MCHNTCINVSLGVNLCPRECVLVPPTAYVPALRIALASARRSNLQTGSCCMRTVISAKVVCLADTPLTKEIRFQDPIFHIFSSLRDLTYGVFNLCNRYSSSEILSSCFNLGVFFLCYLLQFLLFLLSIFWCSCSFLFFLLLRFSTFSVWVLCSLSSFLHFLPSAADELKFKEETTSLHFLIAVECVH